MDFTQKYSTRMAQAMLAREVFNAARGHYERWKQDRASRNMYYVAVEDDDYLYSMVQRWILDSVPVEEQRSVNAESKCLRNDVYVLRLAFDGDHTTTLNFEGHKVKTEITTRKSGQSNEPAPDGSLVDAQASAWSLSKRVLFSCESLAARDAVLRRLDGLAKDITQREPRFWVARNYGGWSVQATVPQRPLDSVVLVDDQKERIVRDLEKFLNDEQDYVELGLPWHRGYLFHGPPGTGKTSLAAALASHFQFDVFYVNLTSLDSDAKLSECLASIDAGRSLLVLEDVDIIHAARDRDDSQKGVTLAGLLNALDGIATPHGMITVMTTNNIDVLDSALIRPGRVDMKLEITYVTDEQMQLLCERFLGRRVDVPKIESQITPAEVVSLFKEDRTLAADNKLRALIRRKNTQKNVKIVPSNGVQTNVR